MTCLAGSQVTSTWSGPFTIGLILTDGGIAGWRDGMIEGGWRMEGNLKMKRITKGIEGRKDRERWKNNNIGDVGESS